MRISYRQPPGRRLAGYSLVEVMVAVGMVSFGIIAMVSMMPSGLSTFRNSMDRSISSQIAQRIVNEARQTDFATLTNFTGNSTFNYRQFTDEGDETTLGAANQIYVARVDIVKQVSVPGASTPNQNMAQVRVRIANRPRVTTALQGNATTSNSPSVTDFTALIPKM
jgi:uncharacterized protein (TIGR02598 family)